LERN
jgi:hypothetical protein